MKARSLVQPFVEDVRLAGQEALEIGQHRLVDGEVARHEARRSLPPTIRVSPCSEKRCAKSAKIWAAVQRAPETAGVEAFDRARHVSIRLDAAAAADPPAGVGVLQLVALVLARLVALLAVGEVSISVEGAVPRALDHAAAGRIVARGGEEPVRLPAMR